MDTGVISKRYAKALYAYASECKEEKAVYEEMKSLSACYRQVPGFRSSLGNPIMNRHGKLSLLKSAVGETPSTSYVRFIELVLSHRRENYLQTMALTYMDIYRKANHIVTGSLTTAVPISPEIEAAMREKLLPRKDKGTLEFSLHTDPSILGGFVFDYDTYRLDASLVSQLRNVKNQLLERNKKTV